MMKLANIDESHPFSLCAVRHEGFEEQCFFIDQGYIFYNFDSMVVESQYDPFTIKNVLEIDCINEKGSFAGCSEAERAYIQKYRSQRLVKTF